MSSRIPPDLFSGLGKATRRGVRTCPKCATVNGTRGHSCKNRSCDFVFRSANKTDEGSSSSSSITATKDSRKDEESRIDCCRLLTDSGPGRRLFSVKSPDDPDTKRGFVVLCDSDDSLNTLLLSGSDNRSRCFVRDCTGGECVHVRACARAVAENLAQPLRVKSSALNQVRHSRTFCRKHDVFFTVPSDVDQPRVEARAVALGQASRSAGSEGVAPSYGSQGRPGPTGSSPSHLQLRRELLGQQAQGLVPMWKDQQ